MTRRLPFLTSLLAPLAALCAAPVAAQDYVVVEEWVEEVPASRFVSPEHEAAETQAIAAYGPFRVLDANTVALVDITDSRAPAQFSAMLAAHPGIEVLEFVEAPGTHDDLANFRVARMVRENGIATRVPEGGSVRSGAVELFLAGVTREIDADSTFAVHGWLDEYGRGAEDYPMHAPEHRRYLDYYAEMGMGEEQARAFYAMTNSVPFEQALWMSGEEMQAWVNESGMIDTPVETSEDVAKSPAPVIEAEDVFPRLAYVDLNPVLQ
ncbi:alpha/beta hydrolase [Aurantiacibacter sp. D1-12]|uniref:alpha/beta hydrolase n=1 Tax=Aurantiacibacter sp. D1-12 TaxID=2993658 RepID=UPI00237C53EF|nr:alpha/beta hydrolase [Aurantiacibacter sp. D1-12]MDE1467249.1 alpha/beta hydrolase [Aurantiacibacter sp. D1-12]